MFDSKHSFLWVGLIVLVGLARPAVAFGAGNIADISKVEGQNWRHGDIEDALLALTALKAIGDGKTFNKLTVSRVYFGNWLRDYSQAIDVGTVKAVSAEAIRLLLCVLGFLTFGYGSGEFEVTSDRLGCYRPEDHIDNPKNYADNVDARQYDRRLRGPVDERVELGIDQNSGMKNYIANERAGIMTSAQHVRNLFGRCIELGRNYRRTGSKPDRYEALRLLGTGLHCLEDFFAHSNYTELALLEIGERDIFPHVGRNTRIGLNGARGEVYPLVTGTFGGVDFLHSVTGEVSDKLTQNEIDELEGTLNESKSSDTSILRGLLDMIPDGIFGGGTKPSQRVDEIQQNATTSQLQNVQVSPREPEEYTRYIQQIFEQIMPAIQFHDDVVKGISSGTEKIPLLPKVLDQLEEQLSTFVFSIIAPFIVPVIHQIRNELRTGSEEIIESSEREQHVVFSDDRCSDPTHSMLSKDHFSNVLNEVAGRTAAKMLHWVVPQVMDAVNDDGADVNRTLNRIIYGVMHHPAQRDQGEDGARDGRQLIFRSVEEWWRDMGRGQQDEYRRKLSRDGVERGENHKEGVHDTGHGHGCSGKLKMRKQFGAPQGMEDRIAGAAAGAIISGASGMISGVVETQTGFKIPTYKAPEEPQEQEHHSGVGGFIGKVFGLGGGEEESQGESRHSGYGGEQQSHRSQEQNYGSSGGYGGGGGEEQSYGGRRHGGGNEEESSGGGQWGGGDNNETEQYGGGRHHRRRDEDEGGGGGGYGGRQEQEEQSYGREEPQEESGGGGFGDFLGSAARVAEEAFGGDDNNENNNRQRRW